MLKPFLALLLVLAALSGGIYALHGSKGSKRSKRPKTEDASLLLRRYEQYFSTPPTAAPASRVASSLFVSARIAAVVVAALLFGSAAYLGLGETLDANAVPTTTASMEIPDVSLQDDLRPATGHSERELSKLAASAQPAPPPATGAEAAPATPPAAEPPPPAPTPAPMPAAEPVVEAYVPVDMPDGSTEAIVCSMPWPCAEAIAVASCESGLDRNGRLDGNWATNGNHFGLFQISYIHAWRWADFYDAWMDPARNAQYAYDIWSESGWRPWSCRPW